MADPRLEIERKYLLSALPPVAEASPWMDIEQGYLPGEVLVERLRRERDENGERRYRTVKAGSGLSRVELEEPATAELFDAMWVFTAGRRLRKRRYLVPDVNNRVTWEVDSFTDRPLVLAEVELTSEDQETVIPEWLAPYLVREVTGETAYLNHELARQEVSHDAR